MVLFFFGVGQIIEKLDCKSMPSLLFFPSNYFHHMIQYFIRYSITNFEFANNEIDESQLEYFCVGSLKNLSLQDYCGRNNHTNMEAS